MCIEGQSASSFVSTASRQLCVCSVLLIRPPAACVCVVMSKTPVPRVVREIEEHREDHNPCWVESQQTLDCIIDNFGDRKPCAKLIANYQLCKEFWYKVQKERDRKGVQPILPTTEERKKIKQKYFERYKEETDKLRRGDLPPRQ